MNASAHVVCVRDSYGCLFSHNISETIIFMLTIHLFIGILSVSCLSCCGFEFMSASTLCVLMAADARALTVMPVSAYSVPAAFTMPITAALLVL